jgi:hypothetical protein
MLYFRWSIFALLVTFLAIDRYRSMVVDLLDPEET